jgi:hypothetical protein
MNRHYIRTQDLVVSTNIPMQMLHTVLAILTVGINSNSNSLNSKLLLTVTVTVTVTA